MTANFVELWLDNWIVILNLLLHEANKNKGFASYLKLIYELALMVYREIIN